MLDTIFAIVLSLFTSFLYDWLKKILSSKSTSKVKYSKEYVSSVKKEFYIGFFSGILLTVIPDTKFDIFNLFKDVLSYFMFFIALMGFMCSVEVINYFSDNNTHDD